MSNKKQIQTYVRRDFTQNDYCSREKGTVTVEKVLWPWELQASQRSGMKEFLM